MKQLIAAITLILLVAGGPVQAQDGDRLPMRMTTKTGERYDGYVLWRKADTLRFETMGGVQLTLPVSGVSALILLTGEVAVDVPDSGNAAAERPPLLERPAASLFVMPTAYPLDHGDIHLSVSELVFASGSAGLGGFADVSLGTVLLPSMIFETYFAGVKLAPISGEAGAVAVGASVSSLDDNSALMLFGTGTLALGPAWLSAGYSRSDDGKTELVTAGLDIPISSATRIMSEVWIPTKDEGFLVGVGARVETEIMYIDFGMYIPTQQGSSDYFLFLPWIGGTFLL